MEHSELQCFIHVQSSYVQDNVSDKVNLNRDFMLLIIWIASVHHYRFIPGIKYAILLAFRDLYDHHFIMFNGQIRIAKAAAHIANVCNDYFRFNISLYDNTLHNLFLLQSCIVLYESC